MPKMNANTFKNSPVQGGPIKMVHFSDTNILWTTAYYTSLKSRPTFSGLQFCCRHYGSIFIHLAIVAFQNREITRNSDKIRPYSIQGHPRSSILMSIESYVTSY